MNPASSTQLSQFSPCTIGNVCYMMGSNNVRTSCLREASNETTPTTSQCGNGMVEPGEDCDCGGDESCRDSYGNCCDGRTCRYTNVCEPSSRGNNNNGDRSTSWIADHLPLVIGLSVGLGGGLLLLLFACIVISCCRKHRKRKAQQRIIPTMLAPDITRILTPATGAAARWA